MLYNILIPVAMFIFSLDGYNAINHFPYEKRFGDGLDLYRYGLANGVLYRRQLHQW